MGRTRDRKNISELKSYISYLLHKMIRKTDFAQTGRIDQTDRKKSMIAIIVISLQGSIRKLVRDLGLTYEERR